MPQDTISLLRQVPLFARLSGEDLERLAARCRRRRFPAREALFHEGDAGDALYVVLSGAVNVQRVTAAGEIVHIARRCEGEAVGEMAVVDGEPRSADAVTAEASDLLILHREAFRQCVHEAPELALALLGTLAGRLREAAEQTTSARALDTMGRLAQLLLAEAESRGERTATGALRLALSETHQEIAERIGSRRETVSRAFSRLRSLGALRAAKDGSLLLQPARLERFCQR